MGSDGQWGGQMVFRFRAMKYEVHGFHDERWTIHFIYDDEMTARGQAERMLQGRAVAGVRVVATRTSLSGFPQGKLVHEKLAPVVPKPIVLRQAPDGTPVCAGADDLMSPQGRRAIGHILRHYLARHQIGPTELMHSGGQMRKLVEQAGLLRAAVAKVATAQAPMTGESTRERTRTLEGFIEAVERRARDYQQRSRQWVIPPLRDPAAMAAWAAGVAAPGEFTAVFLTGIASELAAVRTLGGKMEALLAGLPGAPVEVRPLLDGMIADYLLFPEVIQDVFGHQRSLADFILRLVALLRDPGNSGGATSPLAALGSALAADLIPESRAALLDWLHTELASDHPLYRHDPSQESAQFDRIRQALRDADGGTFGGDMVARSLEARGRALRQHTLRGEGLHLLADLVRETPPAASPSVVSPPVVSPPVVRV